MIKKPKGIVAELTITAIFAALFLCCCEAHIFAAPGPLDQVSVALLGHTETVLETTTKGKLNAEVLITPFQIGKIDGGYLAGIDGGVLGNVNPSSIGQKGFNWTVGLHAHLSPFLKKAVSISPNYPALAGLEINPRVSYLFPNHTTRVKGEWVVGLGLGWSWSASPQG
jgi:hypothetical protein